MIDILLIINFIFCTVVGLHFVWTFFKDELFCDTNSVSDKFIIGVFAIVIGGFMLLPINIPIGGTIFCIWHILDEKDKRNKPKKNKKSNKKANEKIKEMFRELNYNYSIYDYDKVRNIYYKYQKISEENINTKLAENRIEYVLIILKKAIDNELSSKELKSDINEMLNDLDAFYNEIINGINEAKDIENKKMEKAMKDKIKDFSEQTKSMKKDFSKMYEKEK